MTYRYTDPDGNHIEAKLAPIGQFVVVKTTDNGCYIPLDRVEELVAGIRDTARQAAGVSGRPPESRRRCAHTDVLYGQCVLYLDDHNTDCVYEHQRCTCAAAGACFAPAGHYADCPAAATQEATQ